MHGLADRRLRRVTLGLTVLWLLVALWGLLRLWYLSEPDSLAPAASSLSVGAIAISTEELGQDLVERPVFWSGRKPYAPPEKVEEPVVEEEPEDTSTLDELKLVGVIGAGESSSIIVSSKGKSRRMQMGDTIAGWTFTLYSADAAIFEKDGISKSFVLEHANPPAPRASRAKRQANKNVAVRTGARTNDRERNANNRSRTNSGNQDRRSQARQNQNKK